MTFVLARRDETTWPHDRRRPCDNRQRLESRGIPRTSGHPQKLEEARTDSPFQISGSMVLLTPEFWILASRTETINFYRFIVDVLGYGRPLQLVQWKSTFSFVNVLPIDPSVGSFLDTGCHLHTKNEKATSVVWPGRAHPTPRRSPPLNARSFLTVLTLGALTWRPGHYQPVIGSSTSRGGDPQHPRPKQTLNSWRSFSPLLSCFFHLTGYPWVSGRGPLRGGGC